MARVSSRSTVNEPRIARPPITQRRGGGHHAAEDEHEQDEQHREARWIRPGRCSRLTSLLMATSVGTVPPTWAVIPAPARPCREVRLYRLVGVVARLVGAAGQLEGRVGRVPVGARPGLGWPARPVGDGDGHGAIGGGAPGAGHGLPVVRVGDRVIEALRKSTTTSASPRPNRLAARWTRCCSGCSAG